MPEYNIEVKGPLFTSGAPLIMNQAVRDAEEAVADETRRRVKLAGQTAFRYDSVPRRGYYPGNWLRHVYSEAKVGYHQVGDSGIIYGHWLEGTGSRNRTTRFKGYFMWRKTYQEMNRTGALQVAAPIIRRAVQVLNG